jgi:hypothetical protein
MTSEVRVGKEYQIAERRFKAVAAQRQLMPTSLKSLLPRVALLSCILGFPPVAFAYIGPGLGSGVVAAVLGIVVGVLMLVIGVVWYPIKKLIRRWRSKP